MNFAVFWCSCWKSTSVLSSSELSAVSSLNVMALVYGFPSWLQPPMEMGSWEVELRRSSHMAQSSSLTWNSTFPHLYNSWEFKGTGKYCIDIWIFRKAKEKHVMSATTFTTNTLTEADTLVVKHEFNDQPCKDNYRFWFYREFDWLTKCT